MSPFGQMNLEQKKFKALQEIASTLGSTLEHERLLGLAMKKVTEILDADRATLYVHDPDRKELWSKVTQGGSISEIRLKIPTGLAGWVAETRETVNLKDAYSDERFNPEVDRRSGYRTKSLLTMPMTNAQGRLMGVVQVLNKKTGPFDSDDEEILRAIANQAAISLEISKLYSSLKSQNVELKSAQTQLKRKMRELDLLYRLERDLSITENLNHLFNRFTQNTLDLVGGDLVMVSLKQRSTSTGFRHWFEGKSAGTLNTPSPSPSPLVIGDIKFGHLGTAVISETGRKNVLVGALKALLETCSTESASTVEALVQEIAAPGTLHSAWATLRGDDGPMGTLEIHRRKGPAFKKEDLKLLSLAADKAAQAVELHRLKLRRLDEDRLAAIGQMLSSVLHDLKAPMTIISGYAQMMAATEDGAVREQFGGHILKQFDIMNAMIHEVMAYARGETSILVRKHTVHQFISDLTPHLEEVLGPEITLKIDLQYRKKACFDSVKLQRLVTNIARNARQAMPQGGRFTLTVSRKAHSLVLTLKDTGRGIDKTIRNKLFDPFVTTRSSQGGTGLGLAIVKKIVDEHQGTIAYHSEAGQGTTFLVDLPIEGPNLEASQRVPDGSSQATDQATKRDENNASKRGSRGG